MAHGIFISYRRDDSGPQVENLAAVLEAEFGRARVFRDRVGIDIGGDVPESLNKALKVFDVMLAVIGPEWLSARDKAFGGESTLRMTGSDGELVLAGQRKIPVIPVPGTWCNKATRRPLFPKRSINGLPQRTP